MATNMKFKMAAESKIATNMKFKMAVTVVRQQGHNNTTRTGPFQGAKICHFRHCHFCGFF